MNTSTVILNKFLSNQDRLVFQASDLSLGTIAGMVHEGAIDVSPSYQRRERWSIQQQSSLVESFLLNVPVPPIYLAEDEFGKYSIVDGKQRITSIHEFMKNRLVLTGLERFTEIEKYRFDDLPIELRNALQIRPYLRVVTLLKQSDSSLKYEVFTRLNRGGETMEPQELRNVAFRGQLNDLVFKLAEHPFLRQQLKIKDSRSSAFQLMADAEYVLRFLTLREGWQNFSGEYRLAMDHFMLRHREPSSSQLRAFQSSFNDAITTCKAVWGDFAFKRWATGGWRDQFLSGMYDAQMIAVDALSEAERKRAITGATSVRRATRELFGDSQFDAAVRQATNNRSRVKYRIESVTRILKQSST